MKLKRLDPTAQVGFLYEDGYIDMPDYAVKHCVCALHPALYNLQYPDFIRDCKEKGIAIRTWTVNGIEEMRMLCENRIDAIITNYPDIARKVVDEYEGKN
jgi:glycerophosphoryl diester phosphodiesterase